MQVSEDTHSYTLKQKIVFSESVISRIVSLSSDSTYLLYVFNPSCRHCALSIENVKSFIRNKVVDKIIGISSAEEHSVQAFSKKYDLGFETILAPKSQIQRFAPLLPTVLIVRRDTIVSRMSGEVIPSYLFEP
ncbi:MAG: peroxiredoxin family protein [Chlorobiales bacterium]